MVNLEVKYKSQWDPEANLSKDNCGPTCIAMISGYYGKPILINDVFLKTGAKPNYIINISQLSNALNAIGFTYEYKTGLSVNDLKNYLDLGIPVIALVHMGDFKSRQDQHFTGGHLVVVVGYRDDGYFVNDPDFSAGFRQDGDHHFYTKDEFERAWADCHIDQNPDNSLLIINKPQTSTTVDSATFTQLVSKATSADKIGKFMNFTADQISDPSFGDKAIEKLTYLNHLAFGDPAEQPPVIPAPVSSSSADMVTLPPSQFDSPPNQAKTSALKSALKVILSFFKLGGGDQT